MHRPERNLTMTLTRRPTLPRAAGFTPLALALALGFAASAAQAQSLKDLYGGAAVADGGSASVLDLYRPEVLPASD
jgi:hypothetical protein